MKQGHETTFPHVGNQRAPPATNGKDGMELIEEAADAFSEFTLLRTLKASSCSFGPNKAHGNQNPHILTDLQIFTVDFYYSISGVLFLSAAEILNIGS